MTTFRELLQMQWHARKFVCQRLVGYPGNGPQVEKFWNDSDENGRIDAANITIVEATSDIVGSYALNLAFYIAHGDEGMHALRQTAWYIRSIAPEILIILDTMDVGNTDAGSVRMVFEYCQADAIIVNPYRGMEAAQPFLDQKDKGIIVLCRTSTAGASEFQDLIVGVPEGSIEPLVGRVGSEVPKTMPLWEYVAHRVSRNWNGNGNCALVVGATYPQELSQVRRIAGDMPMLIQDIGFRDEDVEKTVTASQDSRGQGIIINSRGSIFVMKGWDFAEAARSDAEKLHKLINRYSQEGT
ncbi:MAG: orotidine-5'-phosphate decarboxylase [Candidatus Moraniibacteriota bacterium]